MPTASFPGHCDFVGAAGGGQLTGLGGNVDDSVTEKHIPTTADGLLTDPALGSFVDTLDPWLVVLPVTYDP